MIRADQNINVVLPKLSASDSNLYDTVKSQQIIIKSYGKTYNHRISAASGDSVDFDKQAIVINGGAISFYSLGNTWVVV